MTDAGHAERIARLEASHAALNETVARLHDVVKDHLRYCREDVETRKKDRHDLAGRMTAAMGELRDDFEGGLEKLGAKVDQVAERHVGSMAALLWWIIGAAGAVIGILVAIILALAF